VRWIAEHAPNRADSVRDIHEQHTLGLGRVVWNVRVHLGKRRHEELATAVDTNGSLRSLRAGRANVSDDAVGYQDAAVAAHRRGVLAIHRDERDPLEQHRRLARGRLLCGKRAGGHHHQRYDRDSVERHGALPLRFGR
jgi:hypothetical protein